MAFCTGCGARTVVFESSCEDFCQFCWDSFRHERKIRLDAFDEFGAYHRFTRGPRFLSIFERPPMAGDTIGVSLLVSRTPAEAMAESQRIAIRNRWQLLRVDIQETLEDIFCSRDHQKHFPFSTKGELKYDTRRFGEIPALFAD